MLTGDSLGTNLLSQRTNVLEISTGSRAGQSLRFFFLNHHYLERRWALGGLHDVSGPSCIWRIRNTTAGISKGFERLAVMNRIALMQRLSYRNKTESLCDNPVC